MRCERDHAAGDHSDLIAPFPWVLVISPAIQLNQAANSEAL
jgi:hypothetical protein